MKPETRAQPPSASAHSRVSVRGVAGLLILLATTWTVPAHSQEVPGDVVELTLEELLEVQVIPVNVMGSHIHAKGEWMIGLQFMNMDMEGSRIGEGPPVRRQIDLDQELQLGSYLELLSGSSHQRLGAAAPGTAHRSSQHESSAHGELHRRLL